MDEDLLLGSATEAAGALRRREVSARELTEALLARIDAVNPAVNAVVALRADAALHEAAAADDALARGDDVGALHGVPITVKESFHVAGLPVTWGGSCPGSSPVPMRRWCGVCAGPEPSSWARPTWPPCWPTSGRP